MGQTLPGDPQRAPAPVMPGRHTSGLWNRRHFCRCEPPSLRSLLQQPLETKTHKTQQAKPTQSLMQRRQDSHGYLRINGIVFVNSIHWYHFCTLDYFLCIIQKKHAEKN